MRQKEMRVSLFLFLLLLALSAFGQQAATTNAAVVPPLVNFSGTLTDIKGKPLTSIVGVTFSLYNDAQAASPLWLETQNVTPDKNGRYSVQLGSTSSTGLPADIFAAGEARWLGVQPQGQAEYPRVMLLSVPYALKAGDAQTIGGLPPSAFVLAGPMSGGASGSAIANAATSSTAAPATTTSNVTTTGGTVNSLPLWSTSTNIQSSAIAQTGSGATARIGIGTTTPASTLDVKGASTIRGQLSLPAAGTAISTSGKNSQPISQAASVFNSSTSTAVTQTFQWQAEPVANNTSAATGSLNLLFGQGTTKPSETGLRIASNGQINFAAGQTFPGTGSGTITGITAGTGVTGGGTTGNVTLNVDPTQVPYLNSANTFNGNQTVNGNLRATGLVTGSGFQIGSQLFAYGSYAIGNAFLGFAGNVTTTGGNNTASGWLALLNNTSGSFNTAAGESALEANTTGLGNVATGAAALGANTTGSGNTGEGDGTLKSNTTGSYNTGDGAGALILNTTGEWNTASGYYALFSNTTGNTNTALGYYSGNTTNSTNTTGSNNTFLGTYANPGTQTSLNNATAVGAFAQVTTSNSMVLGSISGVNSATASTNVGIGTTAPAATLDVHGTGNFTGLVNFAGFVNFAPGQAFPGTGTVVSVGSGAGLTGGPITGKGSLSIATGGVSNAMLANPSLTVVAGTDLTGGGPVALGGTTTLNLDTTQVPQLVANNTFTGNQTVTGGLTATGPVSGGAVNSTSGYYLGGTPFASGSIATDNAFLGFAGNMTMTGGNNTGAGRSALLSNVTGNFNTSVGAFSLQNNTGDNSGLGYGSGNTATGYAALAVNTLGNGNTATGFGAMRSNTGDSHGNGGSNTATGINALSYNTTGSSNTAMGGLSGLTADGSSGTGANDTFLGAESAMSTGTLNNATAIGANAEVTASNALVLGSINGVNGASASTSVGIGTTAPGSTLEVQASNAQNLGPVVTITNNALGTNTAAALDFNTIPPAYGPGYNPTARIQAVDQGNYSSNILFEANVQGALNHGLQTNVLIDAVGDVTIRGNLIKGGGSFKIDHPLDPANKYLSHSFVESPDTMNVYNGNVRTDRRGLAVVTLPDYFEALNRDFRYQLTVIGQFAQAIVAREISHSRFTIRTNRPGVKVSWQVTGIRHDAFADAHRIPNEEEKPQQERGHYLHPELFGASPEQAIGIRTLPVSQEDELDTAQTSREPR
jgi:hypothetical protein